MDFTIPQYASFVMYCMTYYVRFTILPFSFVDQSYVCALVGVTKKEVQIQCRHVPLFPLKCVVVLFFCLH